jgi:CBS-domain-containing membrane protein
VTSWDVQWTSANENLRAAGERMCKHGIRALLVFGDHAADLPGIVTSKDIVNLLGGQDPALLE